MNICVYCSAKDAIAESYKQIGASLGKWIATNGHTLVFGGATGGLMTQVSQAAYENGGKVIGVVPERIQKSGRTSPWCTTLIEVEHMNARKQAMKEQADCFVCLPGSYGTLDEMMDVIASGTVHEHKKKIYILNYNNFYSPLKRLIRRMKAEMFIPQEEHYRPVFVNSLDELTTLLSTNKTYSSL